MWDFEEARIQGNREETIRVSSEMRGRIKALSKQNQSLAMEEIDTVEEWGPVGIISDEKMKHRSRKTQEDLEQSMIEPPEKP